MIPAAIARTFRTALNARLSLVEYLGEQGYEDAARDISEAQIALAFLDDEQEVEGVVEVEPVQYSGPIVHEGQRWPAYGTHRKDEDAPILVVR